MEWKSLWDQSIEDKNTAKYVARRDYKLLFIGEGTVIRAARNYKAPDLREIMEMNERILGLRLTQPDPKLGVGESFLRKCSRGSSAIKVLV